MIHLTQLSLGEITQIFNRRKKAIGLESYSVGELLDHGGMSNVYRLTDSEGNTDYVLRVSEEHKSSYSNDIFNVREMEILRELKKNSMPHVVQYLDAFVVDIPGQPRYYCSVMKFLRTLKQYRAQGDGVEIAVRLGCDFLPLLQSLMEKEIIHRDIKPENIFYDGDFRNDEGFMLGDFGIAKHDTETTATATGTETTMAPEVRGLDRSLGKDRTYSDMYSLGIVMYRYLNQGVYPANRERIDRTPPDKKPFPLPRNGSKRLKALVVKATSYNPKNRFESPQAMLRELQQCEEYRKYISGEPFDVTVTADASAYVAEENARLRRELTAREKQLRQLQGQTVYNADRNRIPSNYSSDRSTATMESSVEQLYGSSRIYDSNRPMYAPSGSSPKKTVNRIAILLAIAVAAVFTILVSTLTVILLGSRSTDNPPVTSSNGTSSNYTVVSSFESETSSYSEYGYLSVGDHFYFGSYPQSAYGDVQPIEWRVLAVKDGKALVISEKLLDCIKYNDRYTEVTWETCTLRGWMNNAFLNQAFSSSEQAKIATVINQNPDNTTFHSEGGSATQDKIFALMLDDVPIYFRKNRLPNGELTSWWWLRTSGSHNAAASRVFEAGDYTSRGAIVTYKGGCARPAMWLILE